MTPCTLHTLGPGTHMLPTRVLRRKAVRILASSTQKAYSSLDRSATIDILQKAFRYEVQAGMPNVKGKEMVFSDFVASKFEELVAHSQTNEDKVKYNKYLTGFKKYVSMSAEDRHKHISLANWALEGPPLPRGSTKTAALRSNSGLKERLESSQRASTSGGNDVPPAAQVLHAHSANGNGGGLEGKKAVYRQQDRDVTASLRGIATAPDGREDTAGPLKVGFAADELKRMARSGEIPSLEGSGNGVTLDVLSEATSEPGTASQELPQGLAAQPLIDTEAETQTVEEKRKLLRASFDAAAMQFPGLLSEVRQTRKEGASKSDQRSSAWFAMRENRLTASTFGNALGFWKEGRQKLWEEKLGIGEKFTGNDATIWGTKREPEAAERYREVTGHTVDSMSFMLYGTTMVTSWLGASPDGLVTIAPRQCMPVLSSTDLERPSAYGRAPQGQGPGLLEIKCPFNKGQPLKAKPYTQAPFYYMPQVQGLMEIFDRDWCNVFSYTVNSAALYHIKRDRAYWKDVYTVLAEFWWESVVPAKHLLQDGDNNSIDLLRPSEKHVLTDQLVERSKLMAEGAQTFMYPPRRQPPS